MNLVLLHCEYLYSFSVEPCVAIFMYDAVVDVTSASMKQSYCIIVTSFLSNHLSRLNVQLVQSTNILRAQKLNSYL